MKILNRAVVILKPKAPYFAWTHQISGLTRDTDGGVSIAFLIPDPEEQESDEHVVQKYYRAMFEEQLSTWILDQHAWPTCRDWATFREWFDVEVHSLVLDLCDYAVESERW